MIRNLASGLAGLLALAALAAALPGAVAAGDSFFPGGHAPSEAEVRAWAHRVKEFRETLAPGKNGRFSAVPIDGTSVLIVDTRLGHLWVWAFGEKGSFTTYQGQLVPGLAMGDIVGASGSREGPGSGDTESRK